MYRLPAFRGASRQRGYGIGGIFKGLARTFAPIVKKNLINLGKQALKSGVQVLDDVSRGENVKAAVQRRALEGAEQMFQKRINRNPAKKSVSRKRVVRRNGHTTNKKKKKITTDLL